MVLCINYYLQILDRSLVWKKKINWIFTIQNQLKKHLVLDSDDDINEIKLKIEQSIKNKSTIMKLYSSWRKKYTTNSEKSIESFIKLEK